ncbi:MAG TPA: hypothetical protein VFB70_17640, partial [Pyrinomonadaceae bacterium]|nr:hypothetical protein [Pyrinomonadaceae bacterium]
NHLRVVAFGYVHEVQRRNAARCCQILAWLRPGPDQGELQLSLGRRGQVPAHFHGAAGLETGRTGVQRLYPQRILEEDWALLNQRPLYDSMPEPGYDELNGAWHWD